MNDKGQRALALSVAEAKALEWIAMVVRHTVDRRDAPQPWIDAAQSRLIDAGLVSVRETGPGDSVLVLELTDQGRRWLDSGTKK